MSLRVLALGGSGGMGRYACRVAANLDAVSELIVADRQVDAAWTVARELGSRTRALGLDVLDQAALATALGQVDVVINTVGPFFRFGVPILSAAIEAGCHYVDICDDWEPTLEMLALDSRAQAAGVTAIIGMGATPGISNLLTVIAARELDSASELVTGWNIEAARPEIDPGRRAPCAAIVHGLQQATGNIRVVRSGAPVDESPLRRAVIEYPGVGKRPVWSFGHPEPLTLIRHFEGVTLAVNAAFGRHHFLLALKAMGWLIDRRALSPERAARIAQWAEDRSPSPRVSELFAPDRLPPLFAHVVGKRDGREATVGVALCSFPGMTMGAMTGIPLAVTLKLLATGLVKKRGVMAPEAAIEPRDFFAALAPHCPGVSNPDDMILVTRSWDPDAPATYGRAVARVQQRAGHQADVS